MPAGPYRIKQWSRGLLVFFYVAAGINHFWHPAFYLPLMPEYFPAKELLNDLSGILEIFLGLTMSFASFRKIAVPGLILLLLSFIPVHVYFIQIGACIPDGLCTPMWVAWGRLLLVHPLLIAWVWWVQ